MLESHKPGFQGGLSHFLTCLQGQLSKPLVFISKVGMVVPSLLNCCEGRSYGLQI